MRWRPDEWGPLISGSRAGQGDQQGDGRLVGRAWAKRCDGPILRLPTQAGC
jgi:hypothetical protein